MSKGVGLTWLNAPLLWREEEAFTPDRERYEDAWKRLFGKSVDNEVLVEEYDGGDTFAYLYEGGKIYINVCGLTEIRQLPPTEEHPTRGGTVTPISSRRGNQQ